MSKLDRNTIAELMQLCRIDLSEEEQESLMKDLKKILDYVEQLQEIETENIPPCNNVLEDIANVMREDVVGDLLPQEIFLANAPSKIAGMIKVPPVLKAG